MATTLAFARDGGCRCDFQVIFVSGRQVTIKDFDVWRQRSLHLGLALARAS